MSFFTQNYKLLGNIVVKIIYPSIIVDDAHNFVNNYFTMRIECRL